MDEGNDARPNALVVPSIAATVLAGRSPLDTIHRYTAAPPSPRYEKALVHQVHSKQGAKTKRVHLSHRHHELCRTHAIPYLLLALFSFCFGRLLALQCRYRFPGTVGGWIESHRRIGAHTKKSGCTHTRQKDASVLCRVPLCRQHIRSRHPTAGR